MGEGKREDTMVAFIVFGGGHAGRAEGWFIILLVHGLLTLLES